jgi:NAD(P)-dependent dehydrogenase (short-subunit alcohol dehydrogenase family)
LSERLRKLIGVTRIQFNTHPRVLFQKCNVTDWNDQLVLFKAASRVSPSARIDIVVANAGTQVTQYPQPSHTLINVGLLFTYFWLPDALYSIQVSQSPTPSMHTKVSTIHPLMNQHCCRCRPFLNIVPGPKDQAEPTQPSLDVLDVNLAGTMYTTKLAMHYFRRQYDAESESPSSRQQTCLVFQSSIMGYFDQGGAPLYSASKFAVRGLLRSYRRTAWLHGTRVNCVSPWLVYIFIFDLEINRMCSC